MSIIHHGRLIIQDNEKITEDIYKITMFSEIYLDPMPGQFILIDCVNTDKYGIPCPFLKRPFSFYKLIDDNTFEIIVRVKGVGTKELVRIEKGSKINFLGPLGNPPPLVEICKNYPGYISLVGGGMGIIPLVLLAQCFSVCKCRTVYAYLGFKKSDEFSAMINRDLHKLIHWSHMHSSYETIRSIDMHEGNITELFDYFNPMIDTPIFTCGPEPMMEYLHKRCNMQQKKYPCYCFMERRMACGIGVCHSCDINGKSVCKDGPCIESKHIFR